MKFTLKDYQDDAVKDVLDRLRKARRRWMERLVADDELLKEWNAVKNRVLDLYKRRNVLAHGAVYGPALSSDRRD